MAMFALASRAILIHLVTLCVFGFSLRWRSNCAPVVQESRSGLTTKKEKDVEPRLDVVLREWQKAERATRDRHYAFTCTTDRATFGEKVSARGEVFLHKPNLLRMDAMDANGKLSDVFLCNAKSIRMYRYVEKSVLCGELPETFGFPEKPEKYPDGFFNEMIGGFLQQVAWTFLGTMPSETTERLRFELQKEDKNWIYIGVEPRGRSKRFGFDAIRVALDAFSYRVRQIWIRQGNGDASTWDFGDEDIDAKDVTPDSIAKGLPEDFKEVTYPPPEAEMHGSKP
jgi:hypothetical protein